jgi:kynurenine 3-monooxygenase
MIHTAEAAIYQPYSSNSEQAINSMSRSGLNFTLIEVADALKNVTLIFDSSCADIDFDAPSVTTEDGTVHKADIVIGADGAYSAVRQALQKLPDFQFQESYLDHGYKELHIPPVASGKHAPFALEPNALHIWPHGGSMMIALPNPDGSFTCTLFWPFTGEHSFEQVQSGDIHGFFREYYSDVVDLMPTLLEDFAQNPTSRLVTIRCDPWFRNRVVLLGDAAHAIVPFYGQGANAAFEDCSAFADALEANPDDIDRAIREFQSARIEHANAIADMAIENFLEMRDHTGSRIRRFRKKGSQLLGRIVPSLWTPLYDMVSFTTIPYAEARAKARRQAAVLTTSVVVCLVLLAISTLIWSQYS